MKLRWITGILTVGLLALSAMAQADHPQLSDNGSATATEPSPDSAVVPNSTPQPQDSLTAYEQQMAIVTVQTYTELAQIAEAVHSDQISSERADYLARRCFELGVVRLQFLDTLHQIAEGKISREVAPEKPEEQTRQMETSGETLVVAPPTSSPDITEAMAKYLELTPVQMATIQARIADERKKVQPLLEQLSTKQQALSSATRGERFSNRQIQKLAAEQSRILERLTVANARLQRGIYDMLTPAQREKIDHMGKDASTLTSRLFAQR
jgi:Spy/CpxP family protein refolding chaperone